MQIDPLFDISQQTVIVTGVAGQLGEQYAQVFLSRGARVSGVDLKASAVTEKLQKDFPETFALYEADIAQKQKLETVQQQMLADGRIPTVLINNAALDSPPSALPEENGPFETYPETSWDKVLDVNLKGTYLCCQVFGGWMAQEECGSIVNVASIYGVVSPDQNIYQYRRDRGEDFYKPVAYSVSKSGLLNLTRYLATYWARQNVRVNTLTIAGVFNHQDDDFLSNYCGRIPIGRMADPDEYNGAMIFLASEASKYMTGSNLVVDGGWTAI
ncbi:SDR family oxidoreductase [Cohaesibacter gelatinilyticus]|uniref:NAD(P)-dependent dehydrogenase, short-chain alcohol dehydrogenase family n=1 Tax=Cohaesibacter gelatinilyticus TaxID=372072 RepID=A0A285PEI5_9HYPH|nr:SDR family oxidoreductase [Cohaesibacter gelatinilyticus]SNZ20139.1 NAD(P)-dependent dehydrogenase, short-chain alcohol dehydrogenase family [Cohaesibacter gelatinilyticus]